MKYVINRENYKKFPLFEVNKAKGAPISFPIPTVRRSPPPLV